MTFLDEALQSYMRMVVALAGERIEIGGTFGILLRGT